MKRTVGKSYKKKADYDSRPISALEARKLQKQRDDFDRRFSSMKNETNENECASILISYRDQIAREKMLSTAERLDPKWAAIRADAELNDLDY